MKVKELIELLRRFPPESDVHLGTSTSGRVVSTHEELWVADYGGGPQLNVGPDVKQFHVYVGCGIEQLVGPAPREGQLAAPRRPSARPLDLGRYADHDTEAHVRDFYVFHKKLSEPLRFPDFDYEHWIPPRTLAGEYNPVIAEILRERLLRD